MYAPEDGPIPLSRRPRERLKLKPDGSAVVFRVQTIGPRHSRLDGPTTSTGSVLAGLWFAAANRRTIANAARRPAIGLGINAVGLRDTYDPCQAEENPSAHARRVRSQRSRRTPGPRQTLPARCEGSTLSPAADLHVGSFGIGPGGRHRDSQRAVRETGAGPDRFALQDRQRRCAASSSGGGARPRRSQPAPLERTLTISGQRALSSADGLRRLQPDVCAFRKALGREIAWATAPTDDGPLRLVVRPFGFEGTNAGYSREAGDLAFGYFSAGEHAAGFTLKDGLIATALSHDIVAHETTHALLDGLRSSFMDPSNVDVPAFHEAFSDLVALFLHFTYADVVERGIRELRGGFARGVLLTDLAREFGYARSKSGRAEALRSGVDIERRRGVRFRRAATG